MNGRATSSSTWPPLTDRQRERLRVLFDLSDGGNGDDAA